MKFEPRFTKPTMTKVGVVNVTIPKECIDEIISCLLNDVDLLESTLLYIALCRKGENKLSESDEIALRQKIFPKIAEFMRGGGFYNLFTADIAEEMFQQLETRPDLQNVRHG